MPSILNQATAPAATITTTSETLAQNIPATPLALPGGAIQSVIVRGNVVIATGTTVTAVSVKLRTGQNNTTTGQVGVTQTVAGIASGSVTVSFEFIDPTPGNLSALGYSITVTQTGAGTNGTVTAVNSEVDYSIP